MNISKLDPNFSLDKSSDNGICWHDPLYEPFEILGFPWLKTIPGYRRLPPKSEKLDIPDAVDALANCTSGGQIRFAADAKKIFVRVELAGVADMCHMPATGQCGFDCYIGAYGEQRFSNCAKYDRTQDHYECILFEQESPDWREVTLNFPLYKGVKSVFVGLNDDAQVKKAQPLKNNKRFIFYGTSITQGGCASRPGMSYPNILSRRLGVECINMGFSGNGKGEPILAEMIASIQNPGCFVLDYAANANYQMMEATLAEFIRILRKGHAHVPIVVASVIRYARNSFIDKFDIDDENYYLMQENIVESFRANGDKHIFLLDGSTILGEDYDECTVDGVHPNDIGFMRLADAFGAMLGKIT